MKFKEYSKIKQFRNVVKEVQSNSDFKGLDGNGEPIYEPSIKPILSFNGTVKCHGTNAQITWKPGEELRAGKRSSLLATDQLNAHMGFNSYVNQHKGEFTSLLKIFHSLLKLKENEQIILYGEWIGPGVQKNVALSNLETKKFIIFDVYKIDEEGNKNYLDVLDKLSTSVLPKDTHLITSFKQFNIKIDFNNPDLALPELEKLTLEVEKCCPVGKYFGIEGVGEGIVWKCVWNDKVLRFKTKGQKHSSSKVKKVVHIDPEKLSTINEVVDYVVTENRVLQGMQEVNAQEMKDIGPFLKWLSKDIISEESDTLTSNNLQYRDIAKYVIDKAKQMFIRNLNKM